jgi:hypothetical protein
MRVAIMQPYFLPYIGYFQLINAVDNFVIYDDVNFIKRGWINRNTIMVNKQSFLFSIPLISASQNNKIYEITISEDVNWKSNLLKTIELSYKKAPYFSDIYPLLNKIIGHKETNLSRFILFSLKEICNYLSIGTLFMISSEIDKNNSLNGQDKIIEICKKVNAESYINPIGGIELYNVKDFTVNNISLNFIKSNVIVYPHLHEVFVPNLSILDVLMFNSKNELKNLLNQYQLI